MAERRMFAKTIIDSDAFLDMPLSAQALYFHLSMRADDDGFVNNPKKIQRMVGASDDDCKLLVMKRFVLTFESGVIVIKHWKIHNYIRGDRKKDTVYPEEMALLEEKDNGAYSLKEERIAMIEAHEEETPRKRAYRESSLPYSFEYKIRQAFYGKNCPVCGFPMKGTVDECGVVSNPRKPTIQHNIPISKGGKHELGNISVICHSCNVSIQDKETGSLNADEVIKTWDEICMTDKCQSNVSQMTVNCQRRLGKDRIGKDSIDDAAASEKKPVKHKYGEYKNVLLTDEELEKLKNEYHDYLERIERLSSYVASKGASYKSHYATIRNWARKDKASAPQRPVLTEQNDLDDLF